MKLEDEQPCELDVRTILEDPARRETVVRSLQEALSAFGYRHTLRCLQAESKVTFEREPAARIESLLRVYDYEAARRQIGLLEIPEAERAELVNRVDELHIARLASEGEVDRAVSFLASPDIPEERRSKYFAMIALESPSPDGGQVEQQHRAILDLCSRQSLRQNNVKNLLTAYMLSDSLPARPRNEPPKTVVAESEGGLGLLGVPQFARLSPSADRLIVVSEGRQEYEASLWAVDGQCVRKVRSLRERASGGVVAVEWSARTGSEGLVGVCSYDELLVLGAADLSVCSRVSRTALSLPKLLTFSWHPVSELVYLGGLFPKLVGLDSSGETVTEVSPFMASRKIAFSRRGELFAIMATTRGRLVKFSIETESVEAELAREGLFMDLKLYEERVLVTNSELIFVLSAATLEPLATCESPPNPKLLTIEAFLCGEWLIAFNERVRGSLAGSSAVSQLKWDSCDAIDVRKKVMATVASSIKIWSAEERSAEVASYEQIENSEASSASKSEDSSSSEQQLSSEEERQIEAYRELMEIEFIDNDDPDENSQ